MSAKKKIRGVMKAQGWTYESLGREIGITAQAVCEIVNGRTRGGTSRYAVAAALGSHPRDFWEDWGS